MSPDQNNARHTLIAVLLLISAAIYALVGIARPPQGTTITNEAISSYLFKTGQRVVGRSNTTETTVLNTSLAVILELSLSTHALIGNGEDSCDVEARVLDAAGNPIPDGQPVEFTTSQGTFLNSNDTTYTLTSGGFVRTRLRSTFLPSSQSIDALVSASTMGASGQSLRRVMPLVIYSAALEGRVASALGSRVEGIIVVAYDPVRQEVGRDTVRANGSFLIPVAQSGVYTLAFSYEDAFGDEFVIYANKFVGVPRTGGVRAVSPLNTVVGRLVDLKTGEPIRQSELSVMLYRSGESAPTNEGRALPALQMTDERGVFAFDSLAPGTGELYVMDSRYSGKLIVPHGGSGTFVVDAHISLADAPTFEVIKSANKRIAEIGDAVTYAVEIRNTSVNSPLTSIRLVDVLPHAFVFAGKSARIVNTILPEPKSSRKLEWFIVDSLPAGHTIKVSYTATIGAGGLESDGINKAYALATNIAGLDVRTAEASLQVTVRPGVFTDRGIVIGKVFYDDNENAEQNEGEQGISGVELWMEDGTRIVTGDEGKYSLPEVRPGQHVIRVNELTLPVGTELLALKGESAGSGLTRFVRLVEGGIARADFYVRPPKQASASVTIEKDGAQSIGESIQATYALCYSEIGSPVSISLADTLPLGYCFDYKSITWRQQRLYPDGTKSRFLFVDFQKRPAHSSDTIRLAIVVDSVAVGKPLATRGKLTLGYTRGKPAAFDVLQRIEIVNAEPTELPIAATTVDSTTVVTQSAPEVVSDTATIINFTDSLRKSPDSRTSHVATKRSRRTASLKQTQSISVDSVESMKSATPSVSDNIAAYSNDSMESKDVLSVPAYWFATATALGVILFLLWKRRRKDGGQQ